MTDGLMPAVVQPIPQYSLTRVSLKCYCLSLQDIYQWSAQLTVNTTARYVPSQLKSSWANTCLNRIFQAIFHIFSYFAPKIWNNLLVEMRQVFYHLAVKRNLKPYLFHQYSIYCLLSLI